MNEATLISLGTNELKQLIKQCLSEVIGRNVETDETKLTQKEAAKYLQISEPTLIDWKKKGIIPFHQFPKTRRIYFIKSELKQAASQESTFSGVQNDEQLKQD